MLAKLRYSVNGVLYIDWALGEGSSSLNTRQQTIIPKLADYGHYAQPYLSRQNGWTIGTSYAEMATYVTQSYDYDTGNPWMPKRRKQSCCTFRTGRSLTGCALRRIVCRRK